MALLECVHSGMDVFYQRKRRRRACDSFSDNDTMTSLPQSSLSLACFSLLSPQGSVSGEEGAEEGEGKVLLPPSPVVTLGNCKRRAREIADILHFIWLQGTTSTYSIQDYL